MISISDSDNIMNIRFTWLLNIHTRIPEYRIKGYSLSSTPVSTRLYFCSFLLYRLVYGFMYMSSFQCLWSLDLKEFRVGAVTTWSDNEFQSWTTRWLNEFFSYFKPGQGFIWAEITGPKSTVDYSIIHN